MEGLRSSTLYPSNTGRSTWRIGAIQCREDSGTDGIHRSLCFQQLLDLENSLPSTPPIVQYYLYFDDQSGHGVASL